jgi:serine/threonine protein kinase
MTNGPVPNLPPKQPAAAPQPQPQFNPYQQVLLEVGSKIGPHQVQQHLGEGGVANVYKVWHTGLEVSRAIKMLKRGHNQEARERFLTEAKILADLHHPNIVEIHSLGYWEQQIPFIEMEFVDGLPVGKLLSKNQRLPLAVAVSIAQVVSEALHYSHTKDYTLYGKVYHGLIHRDIKPDNMFVSKDGIVKLMDFGIARPSEISLHTVGDKIMGTLVYLSPEQLSGQNLDHRTDVFSLGAVLYETITGQRAFPQKKLSDLVQAKTKGEYKPIDSLDIPIPPSLKEVISRAMAIDLTRRYASAEEFGQALFSVLGDITPLPPQHILHQYMTNPASVPHWSPSAKSKAKPGSGTAESVKQYLIGGAIGGGVVALLAGLTLLLKSCAG